MSRYYIPCARQSLRQAEPFVLPLLRAGLGIILMAHGCQKLFGMFGGWASTPTPRCSNVSVISPGMFWGTLVGCTETIGGILLVLGLFTRPAALSDRHLHDLLDPLHLGQGLLLEQRRHGIFDPDPARALVFMIRGGGEYSLDKSMPKEF